MASFKRKQERITLFDCNTVACRLTIQLGWHEYFWKLFAELVPILVIKLASNNKAACIGSSANLYSIFSSLNLCVEMEAERKFCHLYNMCKWNVYNLLYYHIKASTYWYVLVNCVLFDYVMCVCLKHYTAACLLLQ